MSVTRAAVAEALTSALPEHLHPRVPALAAVISQLAEGSLPPEQARTLLSQENDVLDALSGRALNAGRTLLDFKGLVAGQVSIGDVAGRDQYNVTVNVGATSVQIREQTELYEVESRIANILSRAEVDANTMQYAADVLGLTLLGTNEDRRWALAAKLLRTDLASLVQAAHRLSPQLCDEAGTLVKTAVPFICVDRSALPVVRQAVTATPLRQGLGLNSSATETGFMYVDASCPTNPKWARAEVLGGWGDWTELEKSVAAALREALHGMPDDDITTLQRDLQDNAVVLVFTEPALPTTADVKLLRDKGYGLVSFFLLAGDTTQAEFATMGFEEVVYLPELDRAREAQNQSTVAGAVRAAKRACPGRDR